MGRGVAILLPVSETGGLAVRIVRQLPVGRSWNWDGFDIIIIREPPGNGDNHVIVIKETRVPAKNLFCATCNKKFTMIIYL